MEKFFDYFDERYRKSVLSGPASDDGPVITISRLTGCDAREIASDVVDKMNLIKGSINWKWVDKDIIYSIARELNIDTQRIENYYHGFKLTDLSEMIMAFSGGFVSDLRVKKAIKDVVLSICKEGNVVIVGRGGVSIAQGIKDALHVRLVAPLGWRTENVMRKKEMDQQTALKYIKETDEKRNDLMHTFLDKKTKDLDNLFDVTLNREAYSVHDTADLIVSLYEKKVAARMAERQRMKTVF